MKLKRDPSEPRFLAPYPYVVGPIALGIGMILLFFSPSLFLRVIGLMLIGLVGVSAIIAPLEPWEE